MLRQACDSEDPPFNAFLVRHNVWWHDQGPSFGHSCEKQVFFVRAVVALVLRLQGLFHIRRFFPCVGQLFLVPFLIGLAGPFDSPGASATADVISIDDDGTCSGA